MDKSKNISVIVPVVERYGDLESLYLLFSEQIKSITASFEFIFVIDAPMRKAGNMVNKIASKFTNIKKVEFSKKLGESNALSAGFALADGKYIFTLSSYFQVVPEDFKKLYSTLITDSADIVIAKRRRDSDSVYNRLQNRFFHWLLRISSGTGFRDISCGLRGMKREVFEKFDVYGDLHRFIPIIAEHQGLKVEEIEVGQMKEDLKTRIYSVRTYLNRFLDIATLFFLLRFTYRPMRLFGLIGSILFLTGFVIVCYLVYLRIFTDGFGLTNKPSLFLSSLLIVIGVQLFAVGLIGEIIIYTRTKKSDYFSIKEIID